MRLDVVSPQGIAYTAEVAKLAVPGADGQLTILPHHAPLFAKLIDGELKILPEAANKPLPIYMAIGGGFIEVSRSKTIILVTRAVRQDELDEKEITAAVEKAQKLIKQAPTDKDRQYAAQLLHARLTDLKVLRRKPRPVRA